MSTLRDATALTAIQRTDARTPIRRFAPRKADANSKITGRHKAIAMRAAIICAAIFAWSPVAAMAVSDGPIPKHAEPDPLLLMLARHAVLEPTDGAGSDEQRFTVQCP